MKKIYFVDIEVLPFCKPMYGNDQCELYRTAGLMTSDTSPTHHSHLLRSVVVILIYVWIRYKFD